MALGKHDWAACWRGTSSSSAMMWADPWREGGEALLSRAQKNLPKNRVWVRGCISTVEEEWGPQLLVSEALAGEWLPLLQPEAPACSFHGVQHRAGAPQRPCVPVSLHGHGCTKELHEVTLSPIESESILVVGSDLHLLLALSEGHGLSGLAPEKGWSGAAGPRLGKVSPVSQPHLPILLWPQGH